MGKSSSEFKMPDPPPAGGLPGIHAQQGLSYSTARVPSPACHTRTHTDTGRHPTDISQRQAPQTMHARPQSRGCSTHTIMNLRRLTPILVPTALALAAPAWGESRPATPQGTQSQPLNLSLPREAFAVPSAGQADMSVQRNLDAADPAGAAPPPPARLRYGAGYESRQQSGHGTAGDSPAGGAGSLGATGAGRRGR